MDCPVCKKEPMIVLELDHVEIDYCLKCHGIWLDAGELEILLEGADGKDALLSSFIGEKETKEKPRKCPICLKRMRKVSCGWDEKVMIDKCKKDHGLWFDAGELEEIIAIGSFGKDERVLDLLKDMFGKKNNYRRSQK